MIWLRLWYALKLLVIFYKREWFPTCTLVSVFKIMSNQAILVWRIARRALEAVEGSGVHSWRAVTLFDLLSGNRRDEPEVSPGAAYLILSCLWTTPCWDLRVFLWSFCKLHEIIKILIAILKFFNFNWKVMTLCVILLSYFHIFPSTVSE